MTQRGSQNKTKLPLHSLSILLVSSLPDFCTNLRTAIFRAKKQKAYTLKVHLCETVEQVIDSDETEVQVDFVVFGMDVKETGCIDRVKQDLKLLSDEFFSSGDYCMVISSSVPYFKMGVAWNSLQHLQTTYQMTLINGDTEDEDKCNLLGQRILCLVESIKGIHSGFPLISALIYDVHEEESIVVEDT